MARSLRVHVAVAFLVLSVPLFSAETGSFFERHVERVVAMPTPVGPLVIAGDEASWRVDVPSSVVVMVEARGPAHGPFVLRAQREGAADGSLAIPTTHAGFILGKPGAWRVSVDPLAGVAVDIRVRFTGFVGDVGGGSAAFTLTNTSAPAGCVTREVCLP